MHRSVERGPRALRPFSAIGAGLGLCCAEAELSKSRWVGRDVNGCEECVGWVSWINGVHDDGEGGWA